MTAPVSIVIPALADRDLLEGLLPQLLAMIERREAGDEILVIDDTGQDLLRGWISPEYPAVRGVVHNVTRGYGKALVSGARVAKHELVLCLAPEASLGDGALEALTAHMVDERVFAVAPRVAAESTARSLPLTGVEPLFVGEAAGDGARPILCVPHAAFVVRRPDLLEADRLDDLFDPLFLEPMDLCLAAWRRGQRVLEDSRSVAEYRPRIGESEQHARAAREKNRLLAFWKHLDDPQLAREHVATLWQGLLDAERPGWADELRWLVLALEQLPELEAARERGGAQRG